MEESHPQGSEVIPYGKRNPFPAKLLVNRKLNKEGAFKDTRHLEYSLRGSGFSYEVGDVVAAFPCNDPELVDEILGLLPFDGGQLIELKDGSTVSLRQALIENFDIRSVPKSLFKKWAAKTDNPRAQEIFDNQEEQASFLDGIEVIDLLVEFPVNFSNAQEFAGILRKLNPRLYSIASSEKAHPGEVHLTVAKVEYECKGRHRKGVASTFLCDRVPEGEPVKIFMQVAKHFRLPEDLSTDVIMVGPGTGVAPFRAFLEERAATKAPGRNWLFFGNPYAATDYYYEEEFTQYLESGLLARLDLAWSRDQAEKIYVQDKIRESKAELWNWLEGGAHFYVCGDAIRMAGDVDEALRETIREQGGLSAEAADQYIEQLKNEHRYQRDVY